MDNSKSQVNPKLLKSLKSGHSTFVLLTCEESSREGQMSVEMHYDGDPALVAYLLEGALETIDQEHFPEEESAHCQGTGHSCKVHYL